MSLLHKEYLSNIRTCVSIRTKGDKILRKDTYLQFWNGDYWENVPTVTDTYDVDKRYL